MGGNAMYTKSDIMQMVEEEDVEFIRLQFTDIFGNMKNVAITSSQLEKALDNRCMFDGSSIEGFVGIEESDMYLHPDLDSFTIFPWRPQQGKVARIICDIYRPDGTPFEGDPRYILRRVVKEAEDMGYVFDLSLIHTDAADDLLCVDLGGRRIIKKKKHEEYRTARPAE